MVKISQIQLEQLLDYPSLTACLENAFQENYSVPQRHHHDYPNPLEGVDSTLLLMPAWEAGKFLGVKVVTVSPNNGKYGLPSIHGIYILFDAHKGIALAQIEAKTLTSLRTAAASALASKFLSRADSSTLLMLGTGAMAPRLILAHASIRPIRQVYVWGRHFAKAKNLAAHFKGAAFEVEAVGNISDVIAGVDIISAATLSEQPLIFGKNLRPGQHLDLVGSFKPRMREADDETIIRSTVFVDVMGSAVRESGDIVIPLQAGILPRNEIKADLFGLCRKKHPGRQKPEEITLFKSVGHALEDLAAAKLAFQRSQGREYR